MVGSDCTRGKGDEKIVLFFSSIVRPRTTIWTLKQFFWKAFCCTRVTTRLTSCMAIYEFQTLSHSNSGLRYGKMDNKNVQRNLFAALLQNELKSKVAHFTTYVQTCLAANEVAAGCENVLQKLESTFTFYNKIFTFCAFYQPKANLFCRKWRKSGVKRDSRVILSNQKSWLFTQFATTWFVARQVSTSVGGKKKTSLQQFCKTSFGYPFTKWE